MPASIEIFLSTIAFGTAKSPGRRTREPLSLYVAGFEKRRLSPRMGLDGETADTGPQDRLCPDENPRARPPRELASVGSTESSEVTASSTDQISDVQGTAVAKSNLSAVFPYDFDFSNG